MLESLAHSYFGFDKAEKLPLIIFVHQNGGEIIRILSIITLQLPLMNLACGKQKRPVSRFINVQ